MSSNFETVRGSDSSSKDVFYEATEDVYVSSDEEEYEDANDHFVTDGDLPITLSSASDSTDVPSCSAGLWISLDVTDVDDSQYSLDDHRGSDNDASEDVTPLGVHQDAVRDPQSSDNPSILPSLVRSSCFEPGSGDSPSEAPVTSDLSETHRPEMTATLDSSLPATIPESRLPLLSTVRREPIIPASHSSSDEPFDISYHQYSTTSTPNAQRGGMLDTHLVSSDAETSLSDAPHSTFSPPASSAVSVSSAATSHSNSHGSTPSPIASSTANIEYPTYYRISDPGADTTARSFLMYSADAQPDRSSDTFTGLETQEGHQACTESGGTNSKLPALPSSWCPSLDTSTGAPPGSAVIKPTFTYRRYVLPSQHTSARSSVESKASFFDANDVEPSSARSSSEPEDSAPRTTAPLTGTDVRDPPHHRRRSRLLTAMSSYMKEPSAWCKSAWSAISRRPTASSYSVAGTSVSDASLDSTASSSEHQRPPRSECPTRGARSRFPTSLCGRYGLRVHTAMKSVLHAVEG